MVDQKLAEYVTGKRQSGSSDESIRLELLANQWKNEIIDEALGIPATSSATHFLNIGELFAETFRMFKERFLSFFVLLLISGLITAVLGLTLAFMFGAMYSTLMSSHALPVWLIVSSSIVLVILIIIGELWSAVAMTTSICAEKKISFIEAYRRSGKNIFPFFIVNLLLGLITLGGFFLLLIPGIIFAIWFNFSNFVLITENEKGFKSIMRSREYAKGYWWPIFGRTGLIGVIYFGVSLLIAIVTKLFHLDANPLISLLISLIGLIPSIFMMCYFFQIYRNLKDIKGKFELTVSRKSKIIFTLIGIVGLIGTVAFPFSIMLMAINPAKQMQNAKASMVIADKAEISTAIDLYYAENQKYPHSLIELRPTYLKTIPVVSDPGYCFSATVPTDGNVIVNYEKNTVIVCNEVVINQ